MQNVDSVRVLRVCLSQEVRIVGFPVHFKNSISVRIAYPRIRPKPGPLIHWSALQGSVFISRVFVILDEAIRKSGMLLIFSIGWSRAQMPAHSRTLVTSSVICGYASLDWTYGPRRRISPGLEKRDFRDQAARSGARVVGRTGGPVLGFSDRNLDSSTLGCDDRAVWW